MTFGVAFLTVIGMSGFAVSNVRPERDRPLGVVALASSQGASSTFQSAEARAASAGLMAAMKADLMEFRGIHMNYQGIREGAGGWVAMFSLEHCRWKGDVATTVPECQPTTDPVVELFLEAMDDQQNLRVVKVHGRIPDHARERLVGQTASPPDDGRFVFPSIRETARGASMVSVVAPGFWSGDLPAPGVGGTCRVVSLNARGEVVAQRPPFDVGLPVKEAQRDNLSLFTGVQNVPFDRVEVRCEAVSSSGWVASDAAPLRVLEDSDDSDVVVADALLRWSGQSGPVPTLCTLEVYDAEDRLLGSHGQHIPPPHIAAPALEGPPFENVVPIPVRVADAREVVRASVGCEAVSGDDPRLDQPL